MVSRKALRKDVPPGWPSRNPAVIMLTLLLAMSAKAGDLQTVLNINIPAQTLSGALTALATQADLQILFPQDLVSGLEAPAVLGSYSPVEALERLLAGESLEFVVSGRDTVVIRTRRRGRGKGTLG